MFSNIHISWKTDVNFQIYCKLEVIHRFTGEFNLGITHFQKWMNQTLCCDWILCKNSDNGKTKLMVNMLGYPEPLK